MPEHASSESSEGGSPAGLREPVIDILVSASAWRPFHPETTVRTAAGLALAETRWRASGLDRVSVELAIELADDSRVAFLNAAFRGKEEPTNVLSFPAFEITALEDALHAAQGSPQPLPLGDVILSFETVRTEAAAQGKPFSHHLTHLVIHGVLHCLGYDHQDPEEAGIMEELERRCLGHLGVPDPYAIDDNAAGGER